MDRILSNNSLILFQGDSITYAFRVTDPKEQHDCYLLGSGYPLIVAGLIQADRPDMQLRFINRGLSGNRVYDLQERWDEDCLQLAPDMLSILIGVNDASPSYEGPNGTIDAFRTSYRQLLDTTLQALPDVQLVLMEPYGLEHGYMTAKWLGRVRERQPVVREVAEEYGAIHVPIQQEFDEAVRCGNVPATHWSMDGVHPSSAGHMLIARAWLKAVLPHHHEKRGTYVTGKVHRVKRRQPVAE